MRHNDRISILTIESSFVSLRQKPSLIVTSHVNVSILLNTQVGAEEHACNQLWFISNIYVYDSVAKVYVEIQDMMLPTFALLNIKEL